MREGALQVLVRAVQRVGELNRAHETHLAVGGEMLGQHSYQVASVELDLHKDVQDLIESYSTSYGRHAQNGISKCTHLNACRVNWDQT